MTMAKEGTLLIVDDNRSILAALRLLLEKYFARVLTLSLIHISEPTRH